MEIHLLCKTYSGTPPNVTEEYARNTPLCPYTEEYQK